MDFGISQQTAITLAGTVALPSPFPAFGSLWIVLVFEDGDFEVYIKIVQTVSDKRTITRFVRPSDIRAIRAPAPGAPPCGPEGWPITTGKKVQSEIERLKTASLRRLRIPAPAPSASCRRPRSSTSPRPRPCFIATKLALPRR